MKTNVFIASIVLVFIAAQFNITLNDKSSTKQSYNHKNNVDISDNIKPVSEINKAEDKSTVYKNTSENIIVPINDIELFIGNSNNESAFNNSNCEVNFMLNGPVPVQQPVYLEYDLFGLEDFTCVSRSINDFLTMGGEIVRFKNKWSHEVEKISPSNLKQGKNIIRFRIPDGADFQYKIKNVRIRFGKRKENTKQIIVNLPQNPCHYGKYAYINGFVLSDDASSFELFANGKPVQVYDSHFEDVVLLNDSLSKGEVNLVAKFNNGEECSTKVVYNRNESSHYLSLNPMSISCFNTIITAKTNNQVEFRGISFYTKENTVLQDKKLTIIGLRGADVPPLDANMINVTAYHKGFRCLPHGTVFNKDIDFHLAYDSTKIPIGYGPNDIRTFYYNDTVRRWVMLENVSIDQEKKEVISKTNHFTDFINAVLKVPELSQTNGYTPTTIKDIAYASPVAHINTISPPSANNNGTTNISFPIEIPAGRQGLQPQLSLNYTNEGYKGIPGNGWDIPIPYISVETRWGVPRYDESDETEEYLLNGEQLLELTEEGGTRLQMVHQVSYRSRNSTGEKYFSYRIEGAFHRIIRHETSPDSYWWEVTDKNGITYYYGKYYDDSSVNSDCVLQTTTGNIAKWALTEIRDLYGNNVKYEYGMKTDTTFIDVNTVGQLYPYRITYTGTSSEPGAYTVEFLACSTGQQSGDRVSARYGFIESENVPLGQIIVKYNNDFIRGYYLKYKTGAFNKNLLCAIVDYTDTSSLSLIESKDCDEIVSDYIHGAKVHGFQYYEEEDLTFQANPVTVHTQTESQDGAFVFVDPATQSIGRSKSTSVGATMSICFGVGSDTYSKKNSVGANGSYSYGSLTDKVQIIDINGDGLLDKVVKDNSHYDMYPGYLNSNNELVFNSSVTTITGLPHLSRSTSNSWGTGSEAQWSYSGSSTGSLSISGSWTTQKCDRYFTDINGDGYIDFVSSDEVLFNQNGAFEPLSGTNVIKSADSCYYTTYEGTVDSSFYGSGGNVDSFCFRRDPVKMWISPLNTEIFILSKINRTSLNDLNSRVIYDIQVGNTIIFTDSIEPNDTTVYEDSLCPISINKGTPVYFHLHSTDQIGLDKINWDPIIYLSDGECQAPSLKKDADEKHILKYQYSEDALLSDQQSFSAPLKGHLLLNGFVSSPEQSDSLLFLITHNATNLVDTIFIDNQSFADTFSFDLSVDVNDSIILKLISNTNVNWTDINYYARIKYYQADSLPSLDTSSTLYPTEFFPSLQMSVFPRTNNISVTIPLNSGSYSYFPYLSFTNNNVNSDVVVAVKSTRDVLDEKIISINNGVIQGTHSQNALNFSLASADTVFFDFYSTDPVFGQYVNLSRVINLNDTTQYFSTGCYSAYPDSIKMLGNMYRQWGQFSYYDKDDPAFIDITKFNLSLFVADSATLCNIPIGSIDSTSTYDEVSDIFSAIGTTDINSIYFTPLLLNNQKKRWDDFMTSVCISPDSIINQDGFQEISSSFDLDTIFDEIPEIDFNETNEFPGINGDIRPVSKINKEATFSFSFSPYNPSTTSISFTKSKTNSTGKRDYMDMNGDRFPDIVSDTKIQYSSPQGGLSDNELALSGIEPSFGKGSSFGISLGIKKVKFNNTKASDGSKSKLNNIDGAGVGLTSGLFSTDDIYLDLNGDGLPDLINEASDEVSINKGYSFAGSSAWGMPDILTTQSQSTSLSINATFYNNDKYSWAGGINGSNNVSERYNNLLDINNDGLLDYCYVDASGLKAYMNTGKSFDSSPKLISAGYSNKFLKTNSNNVGANTSFTFGFKIYLFKLTITPSIDILYSISTDKVNLMDLNGDNTPDIVYVDGSDVKVKYGIPRKINMLKEVVTPLKSTYTIDYAILYPSADDPNSRWVMSSLEVYDGFDNDGIDTMKYTFSYSGPVYHRMERDFFGYETVVTKQYDDNNNCYRTYEDKYRNEYYLFKGLKKYDLIINSSSNKLIETFYTWDAKDIPTGDIENLSQLHCPCTLYPAISQEDKYYYEGLTNYTIHARKTYRHGSYGNIKEYINYGDTAYTDDDLKANIYYSYDLTKNLTAMVDSINVYDAQDSLIQKRGGTYNSLGKITQIDNYLNASTYASTNLSYDSLGNINKMEFPDNGNHERLAYEYIYDTVIYSFPVKITDYWGNFSTTTYDYKTGLPLEQVDLAGNQIQYSYYQDGKLKSVTGPYEINTIHKTIECEYWDELSGNDFCWARTYHYDPIDTTNRILTVNFADGLGRNIQSKKTMTVEGNDVMVVSGRIHFDEMGRVSKNYLPVTESLGQDTIFNTSYSDYSSEITYDALDRTTKQTLPDNTEYNYEFGFGQDYFSNTCFKKTTTDPNSNDIQELVNAVGQKTTVNAPLSTTTAFMYNPLGQLIQSIDPEANETDYQYDMLGRLTERSHPDANTTSFTYDLAGNLLSKQTQVLANISQSIQYIYNDNRLVHIDYPMNPAMDVYYEYGQPSSGNQTGRLIKMQDASGVQTFTYGKLGELIENTHTFVAPHENAYTFSTSWDYDTWGRTKSITYPDGEVVNYSYDHGGNVVEMTGTKGSYSYGYIDNIEYNEYGKQKSITYHNGVTTTFDYNITNQRLDTLFTVDNASHTIQNISYTYDDIGNITYLENNSDYLKDIGGNYNHTYGYNELYRLTGGYGEFYPSGQDTIDYTLDMTYSASGNITEKQLNATTLINGSFNYPHYDNTYVYNDRPHNVTSNGDYEYTWDANGNLIQRSKTHDDRYLCWDEENRLTTVNERFEESPQISMYIYDANGDRAWKLFGLTSLMQLNGQTYYENTVFSKTLYVNPYMVVTENDYTKHYFIEGRRVTTKIGSGFGTAPFLPCDSVLEFISGDESSLASSLNSWMANNLECAQYTDEYEIVSSLDPVCTSNNTSEGNQYFYHSDHLGSASFITYTNGRPVQHLLYMPFGELFTSQLLSSLDSRYKFSAKELDNETNYSYFGARYYDSDLSNWLSVDPMSDKYPNLSPYNYCANNPVILVDPNGTSTIKPPTGDEYDQYGISEEARNRFDAILHNIESFKDNEAFMNAFTSTTGLDRAKAEEFLTYGSGPKVELMPGNWANSTDYINKGYFTFGVDMINYLGDISSENINQMGEQAFGIAMVLIDELSHCGDMKSNKTVYSTGDNFNNPGKQNWKFSPTLHRGDDARLFGFGIGAETQGEHTGKPGKVSYYIPSINYQPASMPTVPSPISKTNRIKIGNQLLK